MSAPAGTGARCTMLAVREKRGAGAGCGAPSTSVNEWRATLCGCARASAIDSTRREAHFVAREERDPFVARAPAEEPHLVGPAQLIGALDEARRRAIVVLLFLGAIVTILACAEPFADSLVDVGTRFNIDDFLLISLVAPLASEAPELLVAGMFAWRLNTNAGLGALVSSKVNQWTLLVGTLPIVFAISSASLRGLPIDAIQREELFVTAAQSAFAVAVVASTGMPAGRSASRVRMRR